ncbi:MAG: hypothetical protein ACRDMX_04695 [Solirubrobacteraceae bacterium]
MSALASTSALGATLPVTGLSPVDQALVPESVRNGGRAAQAAYQEGVAFEDVLVNELVQTMDQTVPGLGGADSGAGGSADDGSADGGSAAGGLGGPGSLGAYSSLMPQALSSGLMSAGGTGVAMQIATALDPALNDPKGSGGN